MSGGYAPANGARGAPVHRVVNEDITVGDDFPQLCETCLGQNPYVRMVKLPFGQKLCKISTAPYQSFRWKAGPQGRYKETIISYAVAKERNICQTCLNDMKYGLPVGVRDRLLSQPDNQLALPTSDVGQRYFYEQQAQLADGNPAASFSTEVSNMAPSRTLDKFARAKQVIEAKSKTAFRNLPKLCSFWMNGTCSRVLRKTCPFRPCCGAFVFPEIAGSDREICQKLVKALEADGPAAVMKTMDQATKDAIRESLKGNREEAIRKRVSGEDDLTNKYIGKMKDMHMELIPPEDPAITTLWLGNVEPDISEQDLREVMYPYGHIQSIHIQKTAKCAFVEFASRDMAENAAKELYRAMMVKGKVINVNWAKPRAQAYVQSGGLGGGGSKGEEEGFAMLPPPGMEKAPSSSYVLPGMSVPFFAPPPPFGLPRPPSSSESYFLNARQPPMAPSGGPGVPGAGGGPAPPSQGPQGMALGMAPGLAPGLTQGPPMGVPGGASQAGGVGGGAEGGDSSIGMKRPADMAIASGLEGLGPVKRQQPRPPGPSLYPSMNPSRMGAKI